MKPITTKDTGAKPRERPHVLYIEDEDQNWEVTQFRLGDRYKLERASTAEEAVAKLRTHPNQFSAILMDIQLKGSGMDGVNLTRLLRGKVAADEIPVWAAGVPRLEVPIFFVTAFGSQYSEEELRVAGGDLVLNKPVEFNRLSLALANINIQKVLTGLSSTAKAPST